MDAPPLPPKKKKEKPLPPIPPAPSVDRKRPIPPPRFVKPLSTPTPNPPSKHPPPNPLHKHSPNAVEQSRNLTKGREEHHVDVVFCGKFAMLQSNPLDQNADVHVEILGAHLVDPKKKTLYLYVLQVTDRHTGLSWKIHRRYNQFYSLAQKLGRYVTESGATLPKKEKVTPQVVQARSKTLESFCNTLLCSRAAQHAHLRTFLAPLQMGDERPPEWQALLGQSFIPS